MNQFCRRILTGLTLLLLLLPTKPAAQVPAKLARELLTDQLSHELTVNLQRSLAEQTFAPFLGEQLAAFPSIHPQRFVRRGQTFLILPREDLRRQVDFLTRSKVPVLKAHAYTLDLQHQFTNRENFFELLALGYYNRHFAVQTPNILGIIQKISSLKNPTLEKRFLKRLENLISYKAQVAENFYQLDTRHDFRVRYLNDIETVTEENFQENKLVLSVERRLRSSTARTPFRYIRGNSTFPVGKDKHLRIYNYDGPAEYIPHLYNYLVTAGDKTELFLEINIPEKSLYLYNYDKTIWLRVTPHEYENPKQFHVHIHKLVLQDIKVNKREHYEPVLINLSIPLKAPDVSLTADNLYKAFILNPFHYFKNNPRVHITVK